MEGRGNNPGKKSAVSMNRGMGELEIHGGTQQGAGISQVTVGTNGVKEMGSQRDTEGKNRTEKGCVDWDFQKNVPPVNSLTVRIGWGP